MTFPAEPPLRVPNLGYVSPDLWAKVAYDFFCSGNSYAQVRGPDQNIVDWRAASYAVSFLRQGRIDYNRLPKLEVNLKPLCCWQVGVQKGHADDADHFSVSVFTQESVVLVDTRREAMTDDFDRFSVSVFTRESVVLTDTRREATTDNSDRFSMPCVLSQESVVVMDTRRKAMTDDSDCFSMSPVSQRSDD